MYGGEDGESNKEDHEDVEELGEGALEDVPVGYSGDDAVVLSLLLLGRFYVFQFVISIEFLQK